MRKSNSLYVFVLCLLSKFLWAAVLPLSFTVQPVATDMAIGQQQNLSYVIRNNTRNVTFPLTISIVNNGDNLPADASLLSTTCGQVLAPNASCGISVSLQSTVAGQYNRYLKIDYKSRAPLTSPLTIASTIADYTVLVYMVGSDLESNNNLATDNINQMLQVGSSKNLNIVLETGGAQKPGWLTVQRKLVLPGSMQLITDLGSVSMAATSTIQDFLEWGVTTFPANHYAVIYWDHGGGPNGGFGGDRNVPPPQATPINQLSAATIGAYNTTGKQFEIIGFDACLLGSAETYSGLYQYTNYLIGSEDLEPGGGWQYNTFLAYINNNPGSDGLAVGEQIVNGYTEQNAGDSTTLSVTAASEMPALITAVDNFANALAPYASNTAADWLAIAKSRFRAPDYYTSVWDNDSLDLVDIVEFARAISQSSYFSGDPTLILAANNLADAVTNAVKYVQNSPNRQASYGLTLYYPSIMAEYSPGYTTVTQLNGSQFFSQAYINLVSAYAGFYTANSASLIAQLNNFTYDNIDTYSVDVTNDYDEIYAAVGSDTCTDVYDSNDNNLGPVPCYRTIQNPNSTGIAGTITFTNGPATVNNWPQLNGVPVLFIPNDTDPSVPDENTFLVPVTSLTAGEGYLSIIRNSNNEYEIAGFQEKAGSANTVGKVVDIADGDQFYVKTYADNGGWNLYRTDTIITAPLTLTFDAVPGNADYAAFRFLVADLTGALTITGVSQPY
ncbi:clostripain-related cysteine peptidase [Legionella dresdenensis]|uniref:Clostripain-related cysteine peptidase n=1 Tax=Legionella dresdenensis TaxID=450200 RepID=A0ABV8CBK2_9GAMM